MRPLFNIIVLIFVVFSGSLHAEKISDVANTKHNLSMTWGGSGTDPRTVSATSETRICVFCHTPHASNTAPQAPLWNRQLDGDAGYTAMYSMYDSSSMESSSLAGGPPISPSNSSKLCLSCHDGVIAIGAVNVLNGVASTITMSGTGAGGIMPDGSYGASSGGTRNIGTDLTNDHPISITYDSTLATADGEMTDPLASPHVGVRSAGVKPLIPLIPDPLDGNKPKLECVSCHDPHIRDVSGTDIKFLRLNRFQDNASPVAQGDNPNLVNFNENNDIICLACHNKEGWVDSAHANESVADEAYNNTAATERDFPLEIQVWQAACLNCHDTHTVAGSRRLLREGTTDVPPGGQVIKAGGGTPAIEETCYQCHSSDTDPYYVLDGTNPQVPNIKTDFQLARHMPITTAEQGVDSEVHNIGDTGVSGDGKDFIESQVTLGKGNFMNRHAECTDCHNPHRVIKNRLATDDPSTPAAAGTHDHSLTEPGATQHTNLISGVLRGTWGVEPVYASTAFNISPIAFTVKKGVPPQNGSTFVTESYVTREYQVCLKCHSNYGFDDVMPPALGYYAGGTPSGTNGMTHYTNQAMEFQAPISHKGEGTSPNTGAFSGQLPQFFYDPYTYDVDSDTWRRVDDEIVWELSKNCNGRDDEEVMFGPLIPDDPAACLSCSDCTGGVAFDTYYSNGALNTTGVTSCGAGDEAFFANTGSPGYINSPWDGTLADTSTTGRRYVAKRCVRLVDHETNNHRGWHPVMGPTGRTAAVREMSSNNFLAPWNDATGLNVGNQTMYCSDCHGSNTAAGTVIPTDGVDGNPWGPHGSENDFLLKGGWSNGTGYVQQGIYGGATENDLCFKCHSWNDYANPNNTTPGLSGFRDGTGISATGCGHVTNDTTSQNLHILHANIANNTAATGWYGSTFVCTNCHTAVPHGWKNKALLVNLNDVGPEVGLAPGTVIGRYDWPARSPGWVGDGYTKAPYYLNAKLYIVNFKKSGEWTEIDCGYKFDGGPFSMMGACTVAP